MLLLLWYCNVWFCLNKKGNLKTSGPLDSKLKTSERLYCVLKVVCAAVLY